LKKVSTSTWLVTAPQNTAQVKNSDGGLKLSRKLGDPPKIKPALYNYNESIPDYQ
jgi:hypothetical protein